MNHISVIDMLALCVVLVGSVLAWVYVADDRTGRTIAGLLWLIFILVLIL